MIYLILLGTGFAASQAVADEALYAHCAGCHGAQGEGQKMLFAPRLAGQNAKYLMEQLDNYRSGARGWHRDDMQGQIMAASAKNLTDEDIERLASYLAALAEQQGESTSGDPARGETIYADNCLSCHAPRGSGIAPLYTPNLRILDDWYIKGQLEAYRNGWRGDELHGTTRAKNMRSIVIQLNNSDDIADMTAFIHR